MKEKFKTADFYLTCYLVSAGEKIEDTEKIGSKVLFIFDNSDELKKRKESYYLDQAVISPLVYQSTIMNLKSMVHNI